MADALREYDLRVNHKVASSDVETESFSEALLIHSRLVWRNDREHPIHRLQKGLVQDDNMVYLYGHRGCIYTASKISSSSLSL